MSYSTPLPLNHIRVISSPNPSHGRDYGAEYSFGHRVQSVRLHSYHINLSDLESHKLQNIKGRRAAKENIEGKEKEGNDKKIKVLGESEVSAYSLEFFLII